MLLEEATEAGLLGASPFFSPRALSMPFSGGEWAGLTRGVAGSCRTGESARTPASPPGPPPQHAELPKCCSAHLVGDIDNQVVALVTIAVLEHSRSQHPEIPQQPPQSRTPRQHQAGRIHPAFTTFCPNPAFFYPKPCPNKQCPPLLALPMLYHSHIGSCCPSPPLSASWSRCCSLWSSGASRWLSGFPRATRSYSAKKKNKPAGTAELRAQRIRGLESSSTKGTAPSPEPSPRAQNPKDPKGQASPRHRLQPHAAARGHPSPFAPKAGRMEELPGVPNGKPCEEAGEAAGKLGTPNPSPGPGSAQGQASSSVAAEPGPRPRVLLGEQRAQRPRSCFISAPAKPQQQPSSAKPKGVQKTFRKTPGSRSLAAEPSSLGFGAGAPGTSEAAAPPGTPLAHQLWAGSKKRQRGSGAGAGRSPAARPRGDGIQLVSGSRRSNRRHRAAGRGARHPC